MHVSSFICKFDGLCSLYDNVYNLIGKGRLLHASSSNRQGGGFFMLLHRRLLHASSSNRQGGDRVLSFICKFDVLCVCVVMCVPPASCTVCVCVSSSNRQGGERVLSFICKFDERGCMYRALFASLTACVRRSLCLIPLFDAEMLTPS